MPFTQITGIRNLTLFLTNLIISSRRCATNMSSRSQRKRWMTVEPYLKYLGNAREVSKKVVTFAQYAREFEFSWKVGWFINGRCLRRNSCNIGLLLIWLLLLLLSHLVTGIQTFTRWSRRGGLRNRRRRGEVHLRSSVMLFWWRRWLYRGQNTRYHRGPEQLDRKTNS